MSAVADELYSLLVPLAEERLIVPRALVAEVVTWQEPERVDNAPQWYLGNLRWNGRVVPVVSFETACGQSTPTPGGRTRIVICVGITGKLTSGYFGIVTQGFPQLVRLSQDIIKPDPNQPYFDRQPVLAQVRLINETPWVPDLERLEQMLSEEMRG
jgi:chemosensory pili system protein ChpC